MKKIVKNLLKNKEKTIPILSFPSSQLLGISVNELISSSENQAKGMKAIMERCNVGASLNMMDLSVEAEAFGAKVKFDENIYAEYYGGAGFIFEDGKITVIFNDGKEILEEKVL